MRKLLLTLLFWLVPTIAFGQSTTVSGTVIDLDGQQWTAGTVVASFVPAQGTTLGQYTWSGGAFNPGASITISITAGGNYTQAIPSSTAIVPAGSKWTFTANSGTTSLNTQSQTVTVTGGSQTLNFAPAAIRITAAPGAVAYADAEVAATVGQSYYNLTSSAIRVCTTATGAVCSVWVAGGGGITNVSVAPSGACTPNGSTQILNVTPVQIYKCVAGFWQPDFSLVIDSKAYGVKADGKFCFGTFLTTAGS